MSEEELKIRSNIIQNFFEILSNILMKWSENLYECQNFDKLFSPFMLCRYLSMRENLLPYASILSHIYSTSKLSNIQFYKLAYNTIPKQSNQFIKYIKKNNKQKKPKNEINNKNNSNINISIFDL